ncbi:MAG: glutamate formiminotransferase, partial [Acidobacteria bacterium]|nr:glutamate formiminotransferase [Acidobacteriota bacterium]
MIEAIPNVSEGRDSAIISELENAVRSVAGIIHLGTAPDRDHNRTVITYASRSAEALRRATIRLFEVALDRIDLRSHQGEHPRVGAVDVLPFVPLKAAEMAECVELARDVGRTVADRFSLPVFLYEYAASEDY